MLTAGCSPQVNCQAARPSLKAQPVRRAVVCAAQKDESQQVSKAIAAAALAAVVGFGQVDAAKADISGLTPCSESKAYAKRLKNEVKALNKRLKNVSTASLNGSQKCSDGSLLPGV